MIALLLASAGPAGADQVRDRQRWVLSALDVPAAWRVTHGGGVVVAVIDSGVDPSVSDLTGSVRTGPDYTGVGTSPSNPNWGAHGTWMASLIAGHGHGRGATDGIIGVAPRARILSIRVITDRTDPGYNAYHHESEVRGQRALAQAIRFAVRRGAQVISMSLGYAGWSLGVRSALQHALSHGVVVVASSGNAETAHSAQRHGIAPYAFPANYPGVIGVAAVTQAGQPAYFSSENLSVQVAAPGVNVPAQGRGSKYWVVSGTSPACALTAGVAALIKSRYPKLTAAQVQTAITQSTSNRPRAGYNDQVGFGTVDAAAALRMAGRLVGQVPAGQTRAGKAAASGNFGNGPAGVSAFPVPPRGRQKLLAFLGIGAGGLLFVVVALLLLVRGRRKRKVPARLARSAVRRGRPGRPVRPGQPVRPGLVGPASASGAAGTPSAAGTPFAAGAAGAAGQAGLVGPAAVGATDPDLRYPTQIFPSQPQGHGVPVQGYLGQPGQGFPVPGYLGQPGQAQLGPGQYGQVQPALGQGQFGPGEPGQPGQPGQPGPGYAGQAVVPGQPGQPGQPVQPDPGYSAQPGQPASGYAGQPGQPPPGYTAPGFAGQPGQPAAGYSGQPQPAEQHIAQSFPAGAAPGAASHGFPFPAQPEPGTSAPSFSSQSIPGQTFAPQGHQAPSGQDNAGQDSSSESDWLFEDGPSEAAQPATAATTAPRLPIPPRPLEHRQDLLVQPWPARPTESDESDRRPEQGHGTVIPPGRSLLPEPDTDRWLDDPLTSPRYSRDAQRGGESGGRGSRSDWLSRLESITRPMTSPVAPPGPPSPASPPFPASPVDPASPSEPPVQPAQPIPTQQPAESAWQTPVAPPGAADSGQHATGLDAPAEQTPARHIPAQEPGLGAPPEPGQRSWAFDSPVASSATQAPIVRPTEVPDRSPVSRPAEQPGELYAGWPNAPAVSEPSSSSADLAASEPSDQAEPVMRSVWEPLSRHRPSPARPGSEQAVEHPSPIARSGTWASAAWEARPSQPLPPAEPEAPPSGPELQPAADVERERRADVEAGLSADSPSGLSPPDLAPRQPAPPGAEPLLGRQTQSEAEPLPRRQPMTHLAAQLRRDRQSQPGHQAQPLWQPEAGRLPEEDSARPLPSVWDTWRPTAAARRASLAEGSDSADDNT